MSNKPDYNYAISRAQNLLHEFNITKPPIDPLKIAEEIGIKVRFVRFKDKEAAKEVSGFYDPKKSDNGEIFVNALEPAKRQTFTIAHELGHAILHKEWTGTDDYNILMRSDKRNDKGDSKEKEANAFAANLLVPKNLLLKYINDIPVPTLSNLFAVSEEMIGWRIYNVMSSL